MALADYPVESVSFTGLGVEATGAAAAAEALARQLNEWAAAHPGRRLLQLTTVPTPARAGVGLAAVLAHTAGPDLTPGLAAQVAAAVEHGERVQKAQEAMERSRMEATPTGRTPDA